MASPFFFSKIQLAQTGDDRRPNRVRTRARNRARARARAQSRQPCHFQETNGPLPRLTQTGGSQGMRASSD